MRFNPAKSIRIGSALALSGLLLASGSALAQVQQINLTAAPTTATMSDGSAVPMWGYACGAVVGGATATCAALGPTAGGWSPVVIRAVTGSNLQINLTNKLSFAGAALPTSLVIVGLPGGGLGTGSTTAASPPHADLGVSWPTATAAGGANPTFSPPAQGPRVQSFATEVAPASTPPTGNQVASGSALVWNGLKAGTYLIESGTHPSIQGSMGLYGMLIVTNAPTAGAAGTAYGAGSASVRYDADLPMLLSEIDPVQNAAVSAAVNTAGFQESTVWSGQPGGCGNKLLASGQPNPAYQTCYPPVVNYSPLYYLFNGVAFDKANPGNSLFAASPSAPGTQANGKTSALLVRFVNAGLRMHVPSIVGATTGATPIPGLSLIAEDGNRAPGNPRVQNEVFLAAGKTYDVLINAPVGSATALPVFDRQLSLSANATSRDAGMLAYLGANGAALPAASQFSGATANPDSYALVIPGQTLTIADPSQGVMANDVNVSRVALKTGPGKGTLTLAPNGTFSYAPGTAWTTTTSDSFSYCANGSTTVCTTVTLAAAAIEAGSGITVGNTTYTSTMSTYFSTASPGVLAFASDAKGYPLSVNIASVTPQAGLKLNIDANGGFTASVAGPGTYTFSYKAQNSQGTLSAASGTVTLNFPAPGGLQVSIVDGSGTPLPTITNSAGASTQDYRWIIEEDRTFYVDPTKTTNTAAAPGSTTVVTYGANFHTSHMPFVAQGCTGPVSCGVGQTMLDPTSGKHVAAVCDVGSGACRADTGNAGRTPVLPSSVVLDPTKRYYLSVLPGDAANPFYGASATGHGMGGAPVMFGQTSVTVTAQASPYPPGQLTVFVFEDDFPLNGEVDAGGGVDVLAPNEPGLGGFQIHLWDAMGGNGDFTGQMTYDMFNQPLSNSLAGTIDPVTGQNACPITQQDASGAGITGMIVTCPKFEADGTTLSPLAGQAVIKNLMPGRFGVIATPAADRIARGEEWLQTNTLDGQKAHDSFIRIGEPAYFQEFGPAGYHVTIGFANPAIINARLPGVCAGTDPNLPGTGSCNNTIKGHVSTERMSRTPDERLYGSGSFDSWYFTQCYVSVGDPDGEDFAFTKCDKQGNFKLTGIPSGSWRVTVFDKWNDMLVDGLSTPVATNGGTVDMGEIATNQWQSNIYTRTFIDDNKDGVAQSGEGGIPLIPVAVRYRDGSLANGLSTDFNGIANFNETFPLFNWYVVESDVTRYKNTGTHVVYDAGGPADFTLSSCGGSLSGTGYPSCGQSTIGKFLANTAEQVSLPTELRVPGAVYCAGADCVGKSILNGTGSSDATCTTTSGVTSCTAPLSTGRIDPPWLGGTEGFQGFSGQNNFIEFGKAPYAPGENGGIRGHVVYASTRPFDDPQNLVQTQWEPLVPGVRINLYLETVAADGSKTLKLVDHTTTSSFDDWAQGFRLNPDGSPVMSKDNHPVPNMNCPGQTAADLFFFTLYGQPNYLDYYNSQHGGATPNTLPYNSQFKCYDGMHNWNQVQPTPYDGMYQFPSVAASNQTTGKPAATNCTICSPNTAVASTDLYYGLPMLPPGKYVVEVVVPPGMELVKEEDKNILIGDNYIAPATQEFGALGNVFILPDQAAVSSVYNAANAQNPTSSLGAPTNGQVPGFVPEATWPCVGESRIVPDYISLYPQSKQVAPFAGATRNLCDRKEVTLGDQMGAIAKFYVYTSTHLAAKFTGVITDDFTSEFDPFSPQFGEKFAPPNMPIAIKDWKGNEISRIYSDQWGTYDGMTYSSWEVNPPNPTGYAPTMMVFCMNDPGKGATPDPLFDPAYSQFCYELPFMPGQTQYLDTPVVPTSAFTGGGYNNPDCDYADATPAIASVNGDGVGPWVSKAKNLLTINALGNKTVNNYGYSGPQATTAPFNAKTVTRHYGFGAAQGTGSVTIGGVVAAVSSWSDTQITVTVPTGVPACAVQQQAIYGGSPAACGQLVITNANGQQSIDAVTVTVGGKTPTRVASATPLTQSGVGSIQQAIDAAAPGDLIIVPPGQYQEMLIMWKPVRLQGVGAASTVINANTQPAGKMDPWRAYVGCLFGLARNGVPIASDNPFDATSGSLCGSTAANWKYFTPTATGAYGGGNGNLVADPQIDRLPLEGLVGWDTTTNGNLAQLLQEPTLMGAYEGAGITVLSKGVNTHSQVGYYGGGAEATFPTGSTLLTNLDCLAGGGKNGLYNPYPSNFQCNPSGIDGLSITDASQGGGGVFVHAWGHNLQIANNRIFNNIGTLSGGINIGQGESPDAYLQGTTNDTDPGSCLVDPGLPTNTELPFCFDLNVNVHHNYITRNESIGDELFSGTPAGAGGVSFCTGADYYKFNYNWVCGNMSTGDGGGFSHVGYIWGGAIEHNQVLFNQSTNPTISTNGGGIIVMGAAPDGFSANGQECGGTVADADCAPGLPDGTGPSLLINANLIMGNAAASGSGGGLRLQSVNGAEVANFPNGNQKAYTSKLSGTVPVWNTVTVTNNIIANNVAGWDGAGVSLQDALVVNFVNNTVISNDTTASAGVLFNTLGAPLASAPGATNQTTSKTTSAPQPAGLVSMNNSSNLTATFAGLTITCPTDHPNCRGFSNPYLANDVFWQNRAYYIGVGALSTQYQQNVVTLFNAFTANQAPSQASADAVTANGAGKTITGGTGACTSASYWDIGVRGDTGPGNHSSTFSMQTNYSILTNGSEIVNGSSNDINQNPNVVQQYCNGSRTPPEFASMGWQVPPGISDASVPNPIFNLSPSATVDEGNNWVNISWGPLAQTHPVTHQALGNYGLTAGSPAIGRIPTSAVPFTADPSLAFDYFGNPRPTAKNASIDIGAVEYQAPAATAIASISPTSLAFGNVTVNNTSPTQTLTLSNTGSAPLSGIAPAFSASYARSGGTCTATLAAGATCTIGVVFQPTATGAVNGTLAVAASVTVANSPVTLTGTGVAAVTGASLTPANWTVSQTRNCPATLANLFGCALDPAQVFTLTNTGTATLTNIAQGALGGANVAEYTIVRGLSTCGPTGNGQFVANTTLAPGASCVITVQFKPLTAQSTGLKPATVSVTDSAGTQTSTLNGTAH